MFNKRCLPEEIRSQTDRYGSKFVFGGANKQVSLQGYQVKKNTKLFMISTMHHNSNVSHDLKKKSDIQLFYNATKSGVDTVDMMCTLYSVWSSTRRWPVVHFHNLLDVCGVNAHTIWSVHTNETDTVRTHMRRSFLRTLATELCMENVLTRLREPAGLHFSLVSLMESFCGQQRRAEDREVVAAGIARSVCARCRSSKDCNRTNKTCSRCRQFVCGRHSHTDVVCNVHDEWHCAALRVSMSVYVA